MAKRTFFVAGDHFIKIDDRMREIKRQLRQDQGSPLEPNAVAEALQQIIEGKFVNSVPVSTNVVNTFNLSIDHEMSLEQMIAAGDYDWKNGAIKAKHFPVDQNGPTEVVAKVLRFKRYIKPEEAVKEMDALGLRPAKIEELLAFGAKYPDKHRHLLIIALGSIWRYSFFFRNVAYLYQSAEGRGLGLDSFGHERDGADCRYLVVYK